MKKKQILIVPLAVAVSGTIAFGAWVAYGLYDKQCQQEQQYQMLLKELATARTQMHSMQQEVRHEAAGLVTSSSNWLHVQKRIEHAVVQVFSSVASINWLRPYRTPNEVLSCGSAFFINDRGDMLTNYHVVSQARSITVRLPQLGQEQYRAEIIGVCPERDVALIRLTAAARAEVEKQLGTIAYLELGDSDLVGRTQEVMALGFPLGRTSLKSTIGNISGWESAGGQSLIQLTSPLNPGNSGGPAVNNRGEVIGINSAGVMSAQNTGFFIPINEVHHILEDLYRVPLLRKPMLGANFSIYLDTMREYLGNPPGGGWYVTQVYQNTLLEKAGVREGDVLYEVNGYALDCYGEVQVSWAPDSRVSTMDLLNRYNVGDTIAMVFYRRGEKIDITLTLEDSFLLPVRRLFPDFENIEYETLGGMVVVPLSLNVIGALLEQDNSLGWLLARYARPDGQYEAAVVVTHIMPDSPAKDAKLLDPGLIIDTVNGMPVRTLSEFRAAVIKGAAQKFLTLTTRYERRFAVLSYDDIRRKEERLGYLNGFAPTALAKALGRASE